MRGSRVFWVAGIVAVLALAAVPAEAANPVASPVQYSVKFVCGFVPVGEEEPVKPGNYATAINIHNYTTTNLNVEMLVALHYRAGSGPPPLVPFRTSRAYKYRTLEVDCVDIWGMVGTQPGAFLKGMLHLGMPTPLAVAAVYTSQTNLGPGAGLDPGAGISIDVEYVAPFFDAGGLPALSEETEPSAW